MDNATYDSFLSVVINDGIDAAVQDYSPGPKRDGSVAGFNACRGKTPDELVTIWKNTNAAAHEKLSDDQTDQYMFLMCYAAEVEWVLNCLSVALSRPLLSHLPTARGFLKATEVLRSAMLEAAGESGP